MGGFAEVNFVVHQVCVAEFSRGRRLRPGMGPPPTTRPALRGEGCVFFWLYVFEACLGGFAEVNFVVHQVCVAEFSSGRRLRPGMGPPPTTHPALRGEGCVFFWLYVYEACLGGFAEVNFVVHQVCVAEFSSGRRLRPGMGRAPTTRLALRGEGCVFMRRVWVGLQR